MLRVGLTGNFGMGKSTVGAILGELGAYVIDTDQIVRELFEEDRIKQAIVEFFGKVILKPNGEIDKGIISKIIFSNNSVKARYEDLLHPFVFERIESKLRELKGVKLVVIEAPIIFERCYENRFDTIINVQCPEPLAIQRLVSKGYTEQEALARLKTQMPSRLKSERSDFVIDNNSDIEALRRQVKKIYEAIERMADDRSKGPLSEDKH